MIQTRKKLNFSDWVGQRLKEKEQPESAPRGTSEEESPFSKWVGKRMEAEKAKERSKQDILTRIGITHPAARFAAGVAMTVPEAIRGTVEAAKWLSEKTGGIAAEDPWLKKIQEKAGLKPKEIPEIPEIGSGAAYTLGTLATPTALLTKGALKLAPKVIKAFRPQKYAKEIMETIGKGLSPKENTNYLLNKLKGAFSKRMKEYLDILNPVKEAVGDTHLYDAAPHLMEESKYLHIEPDEYRYTPDLKRLNEKFLKTPNFTTAHDLQKELGKEIGRLLRKKVDPGEYDQLQNFRIAREAIGHDIGNFLKRTNPDLAKQFLKSADYYRENIVPYTHNPKFTKLLTKEGKFAEKANITPKNIANIFKVPSVPETAVEGGGEREAANLLKTNIEKIVSDMGEEVKPHILHAELSKYPTKAETLLKKLSPEQLELQGLETYKTPDIDEMLQQLNKKMQYKKLGKKAALYLGLPLTGGALYHHFIGGRKPKEYIYEPPE